MVFMLTKAFGNQINGLPGFGGDVLQEPQQFWQTDRS
jgi:hypothetical protein